MEEEIERPSSNSSQIEEPSLQSTEQNIAQGSYTLYDYFRALKMKVSLPLWKLSCLCLFSAFFGIAMSFTNMHIAAKVNQGNQAPQVMLRHTHLISDSICK